MTIEESILQYNENLAFILNEAQLINTKLERASPKSLRNGYENLVEVLETKQKDVIDRIEYMNKCISYLEEGIKTIKNIDNVFQKAIRTANKGRKSTLQGLCKDCIDKNDIEMDEFIKSIYDSHIEEKEVNNHGGKKISNRKNTIRKKANK